MKKFLILTLAFIQTLSMCYAADEIVLDLSNTSSNTSVAIVEPEKKLFSDIEKKEILEESYKNDTSSLDNAKEENSNFLINNALTRGMSKLYHLEAERTDVTRGLLQNYTTKKFEHGPFEQLSTWAAYQGAFDTTIPQKGNGYTTYNPSLINIFLDGTFRGGKESFRIMVDPTPQHNRGFMQQFLQDAFIQTKRIPHHTIMLGNSRVGVGNEGTSAPYTLPLVNRSQAARNLSNVRKFGLRIKGDYRLVDYDFGGYSSDTFFKEFFPGAEFNGWINIKPLGMTNGKYGKLTTGGGISAGHKYTNYFVSGLYAGYEYKRFWAKFEYMHGNGANAQAGPTLTKSSGLFATFGYKITPKLELIARYDSYDPDEKIKHNYSREYTAGINYYIKGQSLRLMLNYVYCQHQDTTDSHQILVGTQVLL